MRAARTLPALALAALLTACSDPVAPDTAKWVFGSWLWVESTGGIAGITLTPESEGHGQQLVLDADGDLFLYRTDASGDRTLVKRTRFHITHGENGDVLHTDEPVFAVRDLKLLEPFYLASITTRPTDDLLVLGEDCADCFVHTFHRDYSSLPD